MEQTVEVFATVGAAPGRVREVLIDDPGSVVAARCTPEERRSHQFHTELAVELGAGTSAHQAVTIHVGAPRGTDALTLPLKWEAAGREHLFPTFEGELEAVPDRAGTRLRLAGRYTVPLGLLGKVGEGLTGHRVAARSLTHYLEDVARRLDAEVDRRVSSVSSHPAPAPDSLRDKEGPEHYLG
jgi:hypothetical protein